MSHVNLNRRQRDQTRRNNRALAHRVIIYFFGNICSKLITFFLTRLQTGTLVPEVFGPANLLASTLPQLVSICFFEIWSGALRFMYDSEAEADKHRVFTNALLGSVFLLPLFLVSTYVLNRTQGTTFFAELCVMGILYLLDYLYQFTVRGIGRNKLFAVTGVVSSFVLGVSQILFLSVFRLGPVSLILSPTLASAVSIIIYEVKTKQLRLIRPTEVDFKLIKSLLRFSFPLSINATAYVALTRFNEFYVQRRFGNTALGMLAAAGKMAMIVNIFISVFSLAWQETAFSISSDETRGVYFSDTLRNYVKLLGVGVYFLIPFSRLFCSTLIDSSKYEFALQLIPASIIAVAVSALSNFLGHIYSAEKKNDQLFYSTLVGAVVNILAILALLPRLGLQAANIALCMGFLTTFIYRYQHIQRTVRVVLPKRMIYLSLFGIAFNCFIFYQFPTRYPSLANLVVSIIFTCFFLRNELKALLSVFIRKIRPPE